MEHTFKGMTRIDWQQKLEKVNLEIKVLQSSEPSEVNESRLDITDGDWDHVDSTDTLLMRLESERSECVDAISTLQQN